MTRKHFAAIAAVLLSERPSTYGTRYDEMTAWDRGAYNEWSATVLAFARMCAQQNPRFNRSKFLVACGVEP